jgi:hypothetical protein
MTGKGTKTQCTDWCDGERGRSSERGTGRCCRAVELHPAYVDVAVTRWQNFTGQTATLEATGAAFEAKGVG